MDARSSSRRISSVSGWDGPKTRRSLHTSSYKCSTFGPYKDPDATLDSLRETVATLDELEPSVRRVFGSANPTTKEIEEDLRNARAALHARETPPPGSG